jgi:predicted nucleotidyltransferase
MAIHSAAGRHKLRNPRVFGSTARGTDTSASDLDILVDPLPHATLFDLGAFQDEMQELLGVRVDVRTPGDLPAAIRDRVLSEATPV